LAAIGAGLGADAVVGLVGRLYRPLGSRAGAAMRVRGSAIAARVGTVGIVAYVVSLPAIYAADRYLLREAPRVAAERRGRAVDLEIAEIIRWGPPPDAWVV